MIIAVTARGGVYNKCLKIDALFRLPLPPPPDDEEEEEVWEGNNSGGFLIILNCKDDRVM